MKTLDLRFSHFSPSGRIWAIPAIHAEVEQLCSMHDAIYSHFEAGDHIVYHGNYTGYSQHAVETVHEILSFRRNILALPGVRPDDIIYLRGAQEEMMQKLLQIQFAPNPARVVDWILSNGLEQTLISYGICPNHLRKTSHEGVVHLSRWTSHAREAIRRHAGHEIFSNQYKRAAYALIDENGSSPQNQIRSKPQAKQKQNTPWTQHDIEAQPASPYEHIETQQNNKSSLLFVSAGLDFSKTLEEQGDTLWWGKDDFSERVYPHPYFSKIFRGFDPKRQGLHLNCVTATLDNNCGFNGRLICAAIEANGDISQIYEA